MTNLISVVIAMGSPKGGSVGGGSITTFRYNDASFSWDQYGSWVQGSTMGQDAGYSISLSGDGSKIAIGSPRAANLIGSDNAGKTAVYSERQRFGQEIFGEAQGDLDGHSVVLSQDGSILVVGGKGRSEVNAITGEVVLKSTGHCRVFLFQDNIWEFLHSIVGKSADEHLGDSVAVSSDNNVIACGGSYGAMDGSTKKSGVVRLWNRTTRQESTIWPREAGNDVGEVTFGTSLALSADGEYVIVGAPNWSSANARGSSDGAIQIFS